MAGQYATFGGGTGGGGGFLNPATADLSMGTYNVTSSGGNSVWTVLPSGGSAAVQTAVTAAIAAGGGIVQLMEGTYAWPTAVTMSDCNGVIVRGVGKGTILSSTITGAGYVFDCINNSSSNVADKALNNITRGATSITCTTASDGALCVLGMTLVIKGTDSDGYIWEEVNQVLATGSGSTGVVTLKNKCKRTLTSCRLIYGILNGYGNAIENLSCVFASGGAHFMRCGQQVNFTLSDLYLDGTGFSTQNALDCTMYLSKIQNCRILNFNVTEEPFFPGSPGRATYLRGVHNLITGNVFENCGVLAVAHASAISIDDMWDSQISDNVINSCNGYGIYKAAAQYGSGLLIRGNIITGSIFDGILLDGLATTSENDIIGNTCSYNGVGASSGNGIYYNGIYGTICGNISFKNLDEGIKAYQCDQVTISGNVIRKNTDGIFLQSSANCTVTGNTIQGHGSGSGVVTSGATDCVITGNNLNANKYGVNIGSGSCSDLIISGNSARACTTNALIIDNTAANVLSTGNNYRAGTISLGSGTNIVETGDLT